MKTAFALAAGLPAADYVYVVLAAQARKAGGWEAGGGGVGGSPMPFGGGDEDRGGELWA